MVSQAQVYALYRVLEKAINRHYQKRLNKINGEIEEIKHQAVDELLSPGYPVQKFVKGYEFDGDALILITDLPKPYERSINQLLNLKEEIIQEWHNMKERLEVYRDLLLANKDSIIDPVELPEDFLKFLDESVEFLKEGRP